MGSVVKSIFGGGPKVPKPDTSAIERQEARIAEREKKEQAAVDSRRAVIAAQQAGGGGGPTLNQQTGFAGVKSKLGE